MKRIKMLKDGKGSNDGEGVLREYKAGEEHIVTDGLAQAFASDQTCEVLGDPDEEELLGTAKSEPKEKVQDKSEKNRTKNK